MNNKYKILHIESDPFLSDMYRLHLEENGVKVEHLDNVDGSIVDNVAEITPDLICMNILYVGGVRNGFEALSELKADMRTKSIPVVILSNLSQQLDIDRARELGAVGYIVMASMTPSEVVKLLKAHLKKAVESKVHYKRGVFVIVKKEKEGKEHVLTFTFKDKNDQRVSGGGYHLALFNELMYANWYCVQLNDTDDWEPQIVEISEQRDWQLVQNKMENANVKTAVLNPCDGDEKHKCPLVLVTLDQIQSLDDVSSKIKEYPNHHYKLVENEN